ncbi:serine/threonine-protein phosphatase 6 regulatory ankyrin repeat subunit a [Phtheirospermum japonicum]|uniref:Serine/threonine-protein phosphatase 6 regulatory ankyrin repeat subunit a n=1 Tax=Phtheirospermum japonicum TaxID=374723 RepID=A0A830CJA0_9LAMI|nr:serine/threonine-protein phosphatase 6 regulatory ankyrin repeat subunit a [Phtheirospermum japonicum]
MKRSSQTTKQAEIPLDLFQLTMKKKWDKVIEIYKNDEGARSAKLTKSEQTALHVAVSSYNPESSSSNDGYCEKMIESIPEKDFRLILSMADDKGNTPLHLAAAVGWEAICECIASKDRDRDLIGIRNSTNETPLFVAAQHGKRGAFLCLHEMYKKEGRTGQHPDESLCRRKDGNTILHSSISIEHFKLAYQIIDYYPNLINSVNEEGESPLHVLASKPNVFKSSSHFGFYDSIIYQCVIVDELKKAKYVPGAYKMSCSPRKDINYPGNYRTCIDILRFLWDPIHKTFTDCFKNFDSRNTGHPTDVENQQESKNETRAVGSFPANYATCILLLKFAMTVILTVLGVGFDRIKKIREKKERYVHASHIMNRMIDSESRYMYDSNGQKPVPELEPHREFTLPATPPPDDDAQRTTTGSSNIVGTSLSDDSQNQENNQLSLSVKKGTPLLVAAKMGIPEMVETILNRCPVAVQDVDSDGKNVLLLAAENRQTSVLDYLLSLELPEYLFHRLDDQGNSILHLAAMLRDYQPWRIPGAALQMQWEIKWYKHVKHSIPQLCFAQNNKEGLTPRQVFSKTHKSLVKESTEWLIKTSESCSLTAALIATVAFATSATVPGGIDENTGYPNMQHRMLFDIFSVASLVALCLSVTALVFFLAIITSRCQERDFKTNLPRKLLMGLTSLFGSITAMLASFCAGHTFILREEMRVAMAPIYAIACVPVTYFAAAQLPLYFDLLWAAFRKVPLRSYKVFYQ